METNKIYLGDAYKLIKEIPDVNIDLFVSLYFLLVITIAMCNNN